MPADEEAATDCFRQLAYAASYASHASYAASQQAG
jgi:hypothetical protein